MKTQKFNFTKGLNINLNKTIFLIKNEDFKIMFVDEGKSLRYINYSKHIEENINISKVTIHEKNIFDY